ncbi:FCS-Like Zinc finger 8-like [Ipomoea triloba]|uniref:FCS-Like Zinc finger 8-like n=1 Tax=Ipomoea triloba TaxID=35885 RepID=UPI00125E866D|nr:FCS-Like Zinc finger 8-like [Ipomoea triloba]
MLRSRSRKAVSRKKQGFMAAEQQICVPASSPTQSPKKPVSSFLGSPRIFNGLLGRTLSGSENGGGGMSISPTSILGHPLGYERSPSPTRNTSPLPESLGVGLAIIDSSPENRSVLFGSKLRVQIPSLISPVESPKSPADFGIKTPRNPPLLSFSAQPKESPPVENLSLSEMELSEDYTCVITHGPNPKTTHIFDNCVVESCCGVMKLSEVRRENSSSSSSSSPATSPSLSFLRFCHGCEVNLGGGKDIYMYRGERAFCSEECRSQEMGLEIEGKKNGL